MQKVLTAEQMGEVDRLTTERYGVPSIDLMENAASAVTRAVIGVLDGSPAEKRVLVLCGRGNNGGDGAAVARMLADAGANVTTVLFGRVDATSGDARTNFQRLKALEQIGGKNGSTITFYEADADLMGLIDDWLARPDGLIIDALFGTGLARPLGVEFEEVIKRIEGRHAETVAVDIPSGLASDRSEPIGPNVSAAVTVTFTAPKSGNVLPPACRFNGDLMVADIGSPRELIDEQPSQLYVAAKEDAENWLSKTAFSSGDYKNKRGHVFVVAGSADYTGAAVLSGNSAMRSGVGLVTLECPANSKAEIASRLLPEVILKTIESHETDHLTAGANAIAVGCGLDASDPAIEKLVREIVEHREVPVIVDAGALWCFNPPDGLLQKLARSKGTDEPPLILTPHEGEFMRLLGTTDKEAIKDRVAAVRDFATKNNVILVLKGERVLIGAPDGRVVVNPTGNSGLGKAGNGDTLTGILAGFVAQAAAMKIDIFETVVAAVYVAGMAGDVAEKKYGKRVMTASDVRECLAEVFELLDARRT